MASVVLGYLRLARPANLPTAVADILAGAALGGLFGGFLGTLSPHYFPDLLYLVLATVCLYAGGVVFNDVFDAKIDREERPERPIPSGLVSVQGARIFGALLLLPGVGFAFLAHRYSGGLAMLLTTCIIAYNSVSKNHGFFGPLNMGVCRALNLLMGMSIFGDMALAPFAVIPLVYIFAITLISRGEVHGDNKKNIIWAGVLYAIVILGVIVLHWIYKTEVLMTLPYVFIFAIAVYRPLRKAYRVNTPGNIKKAVVSGVLSLIILDAAMASPVSIWWYPLLILLLLPCSWVLSKLFAVT